MELFFSKYWNFDTFYKFLTFFFLFCLFFPTRHIFFCSQAYKIGQYSDFTAFSIYLSDTFLILLAFFAIFRHGYEFFRQVGNLKWLALWLLIIFAIHLDPKDPGPLYWAAKWLEFLVAYGTAATLLAQKPLKDYFLRTFVGLSTIQA